MPTKKLEKQIGKIELTLESLKSETSEKMADALYTVTESYGAKFKDIEDRIGDLKEQQIEKSERQIALLEGILENSSNTNDQLQKTNTAVNKLTKSVISFDSRVVDIEELREGVQNFKKINFAFKYGGWITLGVLIAVLNFHDTIIKAKLSILKAIEGFT